VEEVVELILAVVVVLEDIELLLKLYLSGTYYYSNSWRWWCWFTIWWC
jgi:hypothetical protein